MKVSSYTTIGTPGEAKLVVRKSTFLSFALPVWSVDEVDARVREARKKYYDARHVCYAYVLEPDGSVERGSDNGEPSGTAGRPILGVIRSASLTGVLIIVVRYFGGIKLGAGGLTRAYSSSLADTVKLAPIVRYTPYEKYILTLPYTAVGAFENYIKDTDIRVEDRSFTDKVQITYLTLPENAAKHEKTFTDMTGGKAELEKVDEVYVKIAVTSD